MRVKGGGRNCNLFSACVWPSSPCEHLGSLHRERPTPNHMPDQGRPTRCLQRAPSQKEKSNAAMRVSRESCRITMCFMARGDEFPLSTLPLVVQLQTWNRRCRARLGRGFVFHVLDGPRTRASRRQAMPLPQPNALNHLNERPTPFFEEAAREFRSPPHEGHVPCVNTSGCRGDRQDWCDVKRRTTWHRRKRRSPQRHCNSQAG